MFDEIKDFIKAQTNNSDNYDEKNMKIWVNSNDDLPLETPLLMYSLVIIIRTRSVCNDENKYYLKHL